MITLKVVSATMSLQVMMASIIYMAVKVTITLVAVLVMTQ